MANEVGGRFILVYQSETLLRCSKIAPCDEVQPCAAYLRGDSSCARIARRPGKLMRGMLGACFILAIAMGIGFILAIAMFGCATPASAAQLTLTWQDNAGNEDGFMIERGPVVTGPFSQINTVGANILTYIDAGLLDGVSFCYRVRSFNAVAPSAYTNIACGTIPLGAPTLSALMFISGQGVKLTWVRNSANETGYEVEKASAAGGPFTRIVITTVAGATTYTDATCVVEGVTCFYRVRAVNAIMASLYSGVLSITVPQTAPSPPSNLTVAKVGSGAAGGLVSSAPSGINCGSDCAQAYPAGATITLTASAQQWWRYYFVRWTGASGCNTARTCTVAMSADRVVSAQFNKR